MFRPPSTVLKTDLWCSFYFRLLPLTAAYAIWLQGLVTLVRSRFRFRRNVVGWQRLECDEFAQRDRLEGRSLKINLAKERC